MNDAVLTDFTNTHQQEADICVLGSGPTGAMASLMLSKLKIRHTVLDKAKFPRDKTCGDGLILHVFKALRQIDPSLVDKLIAHPAFLQASEAKFYVNDHTAINVQYDASSKPHLPILYGKRVDFDAFLTAQLPSDYADLQLGVGVKHIAYDTQGGGVLLHTDHGNQIRTKLVIGADGAHALVSRKLAGNTLRKDHSSTFISAYFQGVGQTFTSDGGEIRLLYHGMPLLFYLFPLPGGCVNVSLGGNSALIASCKINLKEQAKQIIGSHPQVMHKFQNAKQAGEWRGWSIPSYFGHVKVSGNHFLLAGDAAGLANAFYKEGVGTGMMSGLFAAEKAAQALSAQRFDAHFLSDYDLRLDQEFGRHLKQSRFAYRLTRKPYIFSLLTRFAKKKIESGINRMIQRHTYPV
jgi:menaquinone-9 beta-reductase